MQQAVAEESEICYELHSKTPSQETTKTHRKESSLCSLSEMKTHRKTSRAETLFY
ncbi:hypothetical protein I79_012039 [Cricetulus griseus]|uniref:Uncharacterized protein n=1 Tax=Cricetulus griseus TaxID=10029 RepID=G3HMR7_CRIGR|nr:hypothetical protein I79_012039 [Cricetulus griseus]